MFDFSQHGWGIDYGNLVSEHAASSLSSCPALQQIAFESRSSVNLPERGLCPDTAALLLLTGTIPFLSHRACRAEKTRMLPRFLHTPCQRVCVLLCLISFVKKKTETRPNRKKETWSSFEDEEVEAFDVIFVPSVHLS